MVEHYSKPLPARCLKLSIAAGVLFFGMSCEYAPESRAEDMKDLKSAYQLIIAFQQHGKPPAVAPDPHFKEITPKDGFAKAGVQVFKTSDFASYVIRGTQVYRIGRSFGGNGIDSICVADLEGNGNQLLVYACSWGSGLHRSQLGAFDPKDGKDYMAKVSYYEMDDLTVSSPDGHAVDVTARGKNVGKLNLKAMPDHKKALELALEADTPDWAKSSFK